MPYYRSAVVVDLDTIRNNFLAVKQKVGDDTGILAVIKADAYGHGAIETARELEKLCDFFGVADIDEAMQLRIGGFNKPILILGRTDPYYSDAIIKYDIRTTVSCLSDAESLSEEGARQGKKAKIHIALDTGMSRIGFQADEISEIVKISKLPYIEIEGVFSHFATADESDLSKAEKQKELFDSMLKEIEKEGISIPIRHMNNSAGIINFSRRYDLVRAGIVLYGLYPSHDIDKSLLDVKPAMRWVAKISHVKTLPAGREVSYGGTYVTTRETRVATVPVGYADGYPRCLSDKGEVLVNGRRVPIIGRICMDQFMIDVTGVPDVTLGTEITLVGKDGDDCLTMEEVSEKAHSFNYELLCRISRRVPRIYYKNGKEAISLHYLLD
ncbi:MAG: alanine racemase [Ruminococcaceae bacterium]|nr:alanine racemase [Oscillospiraceae bacterium]